MAAEYDDEIKSIFKDIDLNSVSPYSTELIKLNDCATGKTYFQIITEIYWHLHANFARASDFSDYFTTKDIEALRESKRKMDPVLMF